MLVNFQFYDNPLNLNLEEVSYYIDGVKKKHLLVKKDNYYNIWISVARLKDGEHIVQLKYKDSELANFTLDVKNSLSNKVLINKSLAFENIITNSKLLDNNPFQLNIELTNRCPLMCPMCRSPYVMKKVKYKDMTREIFEKLLDWASYCSNIEFTGWGENMVHNNISEFLSLLRQRNKFANLNLTTALKFLKKDFLDSIFNLDYITISFDSHTKEKYEKIRSGAKFEETVQNIKELLHFIGERGSPLVAINFTVMKENIEDIPDFIEFAHKIGIKYINFHRVNPFTPVFYFENDCYNYLVPEENLYNSEIWQKAREVAQKCGVEVFSAFLNYQRKGLGAILKDAMSKQIPVCLSPFTTVYVRYNGDVLPCCVMGLSNIKGFGNLTQEEPEKIWNSPAFVELREKHIEGKLPSICKMCIEYQGGVISLFHLFKLNNP